MAADDEKRCFFFRIYRELQNRIKIFTNLRIDMLDNSSLQRRVKEIGKATLPEEHER